MTLPGPTDPEPSLYGPSQPEPSLPGPLKWARVQSGPEKPGSEAQEILVQEVRSKMCRSRKKTLKFRWSRK